MPFNFDKITNLIVVLTIFCLWFTVYFEQQIEQIFAFILVLSFGILHGANDFKLLSKNLVKSKALPTQRLLLVAYVITVLMGAVSFYYYPLLALIVFILVSGYHFGEQHWEHQLQSNTNIRHFLYGTYGLFILSLLFFTNSKEVLDIIYNLTSKRLSTQTIKIGLLSSGVLFAISLLYALRYTSNKIKPLKEAFYLAIFFIVFKMASLIWAFSIYFILWHSIPSLFEQVHFLYGDFNKQTIIAYLKSSFIYWLISILGLAGLYLFLKDSQLLFLSVFFSFLAAITFPHVIVMFKLHDRNTENEFGINETD